MCQQRSRVWSITVQKLARLIQGYEFHVLILSSRSRTMRLIQADFGVAVIIGAGKGHISRCTIRFSGFTSPIDWGKVCHTLPCPFMTESGMWCHVTCSFPMPCSPSSCLVLLIADFPTHDFLLHLFL